MEVKIGVQYAARELVMDSDQSADEIEAAVAEALATESGLLTLTDHKGRKLIVAGAKVTYVELGSPASGQVGFRS